MNDRTSSFTAILIAGGQQEVDDAVDVIWFLSKFADLTDGVSVNDIVSFMSDNRIRSGVNKTRLAARLAKKTDYLVRGKQSGTYRIKAAKDSEFNQTYAPLLDPSATLFHDHVISDVLSLGGRLSLDRIRNQANGCYEHAFYDGCAVLCRRLTEMLLVEALVAKGGQADITDAKGQIVQFAELIRIAQSGKVTRLSRTAVPTLEKIKAVGDAAAHNRYYLSTKRDLDELNPNMRHLLTELAALAGL